MALDGSRIPPSDDSRLPNPTLGADGVLRFAAACQAAANEYVRPTDSVRVTAAAWRILGAYPASAMVVLVPRLASVLRQVAQRTLGISYWGPSVQACNRRTGPRDRAVQALDILLRMYSRPSITLETIARHEVSNWVQPTDYDRSISCEINVYTNCCGSTSADDSDTVLAELTPYTTVGSDTGNYYWNGIRRRDVWYQIWHSNSTPWDRMGTISEWFGVLSNPCNYEIQKAVGSVNSSGQFLDTYYSAITDPACAVLATQEYRLSTSANQMILQQTWRWDNTGIWRQ